MACSSSPAGSSGFMSRALSEGRAAGSPPSLTTADTPTEHSSPGKDFRERAGRWVVDPGACRGIAAPRPGALSGIGSLVFTTKWVPLPLAVISEALVSAASFRAYSNVATGLNASFMTVQTIRIRVAGLGALVALVFALAAFG